MLPRRTSPTWRSVLVAGTAPRLNADVVGVALLAAEAKRRGGLMLRERKYVAFQGESASPLSKRRVYSLEKDVKALMKTVTKAKARVNAQLRSANSSHSSYCPASPRSVISKR